MGLGWRFRMGLATAVLVVAATASCGSLKPASCSQCGRDECRNLTFTITLADGGTVKTCCPRCALRYLSRESPAVETLAVRSFADAATLDARRAFYVEGSDVHPCTTMDASAPTDERGCCLKAVFDRCEPSLLAFASAGQAESFAREHGGFVKTFEILQTSIR